MTTYNELINLILDELKIVSDDSFFQKEHALYLIDKYRAFLLKQRYSDIKKEIPDSNYQSIIVNMEPTDNTISHYLKSKEEVPDLMQIGSQRITSTDSFNGDFAYVTNERFKYVGNSKYTKSQIYTTIGPDSYLYLKSGCFKAYYIEKIRITGIFEDCIKASSFDTSECDIMDKEVPLEASLINPLVELIVKELSGVLYQPADNENNASDDLSKLANYIARNLKQDRT